MKIYGYTVVDTLGFNNGTESLTELFTDRETRNKSAYEHYVNEMEYTDEYDGFYDEEDAQILSEEEFISVFEEEYGLIQRHDSHCQIEPWEREL